MLSSTKTNVSIKTCIQNADKLKIANLQPGWNIYSFQKARKTD
jgi:hypothetical protein